MLGLTPEVAERIREYRSDQRIDSDNEAIRRLIGAGLKAVEKVPMRNPKPGGGAREAEPPDGQASTVEHAQDAESIAGQALPEEAQLRALREQGGR